MNTSPDAATTALGKSKGTSRLVRHATSSRLALMRVPVTKISVTSSPGRRSSSPSVSDPPVSDARARSSWKELRSLAAERGSAAASGGHANTSASSHVVDEGSATSTAKAGSLPVGSLGVIDTPVDVPSGRSAPGMMVISAAGMVIG